MSSDHFGSQSLRDGVRQVLNSVRWRIRQRNAIAAASLGAVCGGFTAVALAGVAAVTPLPWLWLPLAMIAMAAAGGLVGAALPVSLATAARRIDAYYGMKDRAITALQFESDPDPVRQMQVNDARHHLRQVRPEDCIRFVPHRPALFSAATLGLLAWAVLLLTPPQSLSDEAPVVDLAVQQASLLRQTMMPEVAALRQEDADVPEIDALTEQLEELLDEMESESVDELDLMAKLSEIEQAIAQTRDAMQIDVVAAQLNELAAALQGSEAMKRSATAMQEKRYEDAGKQLESIDPAALSDQERRAVSDDLKKFLSKLSQAKSGKLSQAAREIQQGLEQKNDSQCKDGLCQLASLCQTQALNQKIGDCMACQLNRLAQCKGQCRGAGKNGGESVAKSDSPSQKWGRGASGNPEGQQTDLDSTRHQEQLTGAQGAGPSESEVLEAPEGEQAAARAFAARYQKFRSQAEAVLDSEPLPLGHRETVRQYFERIRPDREFSAD